MSSVDLVEEALRLIDAAEKKMVVLRLMGAGAVRFHCSKFRHLHLSMGRELTDIDLMSYGRYNRAVGDLFRGLGYVSTVSKLVALAGRKRHIYYDKSRGIAVDVFFDKLEMCHTIDFSRRLEVDYPTIPLAELLLEKTQIVEINEKDIKDVIVLFREHEVGDDDREMVNQRRIAKVLRKDWGFYYTVTRNLKFIRDEFLSRYKVLSEDDRMDVSSKIDKILERIEDEPKSLRWKLRARTGPSKKWYRDVEEVPVHG